MIVDIITGLLILPVVIEVRMQILRLFEAFVQLVCTRIRTAYKCIADSLILQKLRDMHDHRTAHPVNALTVLLIKKTFDRLKYHDTIINKTTDIFFCQQPVIPSPFLYHVCDRTGSRLVVRQTDIQ